MAQAVASQTLLTTQVPVLPDISDGVAYELGMKFQAGRSGQVTALRYWKAASDGGSHVGTLWSSAGAPLASVTFTGETASGWQQQALATPVTIQPNTTYVVSVTANSNFADTNGGLAGAIVNGDLSSVADGSNGVFGSPGAYPTGSFQNSNYFRDVVFIADAAASMTKVSGDNQSGTAGTTLPNPLVIQIKDANNNPQPGTAVTFSVTAGVGSLSVSNATTDGNGQAFTVLTLGNAAGTNAVHAAAAGVGAVDFTATAVAAPPTTGETVLTTQVPAAPNVTDGVSYELGMKFTSTRPGQILSVRYWKPASENGTHVGRIWSATGTLLASATFTGETSSGWQQQNLPTPLHIQANTTYVVSVNLAGYYAYSGGGLATAIVNGDLSSVADGNNGVFGASGSFPSSSFQNGNYFRDIVFAPDNVPSLVKASGDNQGALPGTTLPNPLVVKILNGLNPVPGVTVNFAVINGSGTLSAAAAVTDSNGLAGTTLTVGGAPGSIVIQASVQNVGSVNFNATAANGTFVENTKPGTTAWQIAAPVTMSAPEIAGYAGATSVAAGATLPFNISVSPAGQYTIDVYRLGYYGGSGGTLVQSIGPLSGTQQAPCGVTDPSTNLIECKWPTTYTLAVGSNWISGFYVAKLTASASGKQTHIWFVVRNDTSHADLVFQVPFTTFQAYNEYGSSVLRSLYSFNSTAGLAAQKVSFDRPFAQVTIDPSLFDNPLNNVYNMIRWLESQSYDVTYITNLDIHTNAGLLLQHKAYLSVGHDEYWSLEMRNGVQQARDTGVNLAFFSANTAYWRVRFEPSSSGVANRVMVCYKDPVNTPDPVTPTYRWRDPQNNRPENALLGVMYIADDPQAGLDGGNDFVVANASDPYYNNTGLVNGSVLPKLIGWEWDAVINNGFTPSGLVVLGQSTTTPTEVIDGLPPGTNTQISNAVRYTAASGAKVFATGSIQWMWALDSAGVIPPRTDPRAQQFVVNVLANMGAKPVTPASGLIVP